MAKTATKVRKKVKKNVAEGIAHIHASFNNTIVTISDQEGNPNSRSSPSKCTKTVGALGPHLPWRPRPRSVRYPSDAFLQTLRAAVAGTRRYPRKHLHDQS